MAGQTPQRGMPHTPQQALEFCQRLKDANQYPLVVPMGTTDYLVLRPLMFHWTMMRGVMGDFDGIDERWCYANGPLAHAALLEWQAREYEGEPLWWHRHPTTGRRRPDGDASKEYVQW